MTRATHPLAGWICLENGIAEAAWHTAEVGAELVTEGLARIDDRATAVAVLAPGQVLDAPAADDAAREQARQAAADLAYTQRTGEIARLIRGELARAGSADLTRAQLLHPLVGTDRHHGEAALDRLGAADKVEWRPGRYPFDERAYLCPEGVS